MRQGSRAVPQATPPLSSGAKESVSSQPSCEPEQNLLLESANQLPYGGESTCAYSTPGTYRGSSICAGANKQLQSILVEMHP